MSKVTPEERIEQAHDLRVDKADQDAKVPPAKNQPSGDQKEYKDHGGTFTKGLPHDNFGRVNQAAFDSFTDALESGKFSDFEKIIVGGTRTLTARKAA